MSTKPEINALENAALERAKEAFYKATEAWASLSLIYGLRYRDVAGLTSAAFVNAAKKDLERSRGKASQRDVAERAGVSLAQTNQILNGITRRRSKPKIRRDLTGLLHHWRNTAPYGKKGRARKLVITADIGYDFRSLCALACPDRGYQNCLKELHEIGCISIEDDHSVELRNVNFIHAGLDIDSFELNAEYVSDFIKTFAESLTVDDHASGTQRLKHYARVHWNNAQLDSPKATYISARKLLDSVSRKATELLDSHEVDGTEAGPDDPIVKIILAAITKPILIEENDHEN